MSKNAITKPEESPYVALQPVAEGMPSLAEVMKVNIGTGGISEFDLERIKVPAGGGKAWEIDGEPTKEFDAIVLAHRQVRSYWKDRYAGGNVPPDCSSPDAEFGIGDPGGDCHACPMAQFGSAMDEKGKPGKGQACKLMQLLLILTEGSKLPKVLSVPPSSLKSMRKYGVRLVGMGLMLPHVVTRFALAQAEGGPGGGIKYSVVAPEYLRTLEPGELQLLTDYRDAIMPLFERQTVSHEEVEG